MNSVEIFWNWILNEWFFLMFDRIFDIYRPGLAGTASALSMTKPITLQSSSKAMFYGLLTVTVCLLHAGDAFSCIFKRPVILSILSWQGAAVLPLAETRWRLNGPPLSCKIMKSWSWWIFWSQCNALLDPAAAFTSILNAIGRQYEKK